MIAEIILIVFAVIGMYFISMTLFGLILYRWKVNIRE